MSDQENVGIGVIEEAPKEQSKVAPKEQSKEVNETASVKKGAPEKETETKTEDYILFPDLDVDGFTIRPWTLGKLRKINPHLEAIFKNLDDKNIQLTLDNFGEHLKDVYFAAVPEIISILGISLDKSEDDLEDVTIPQAIKLIYAVFKQNEDSIKNVSSLLQLANVE